MGGVQVQGDGGVRPMTLTDTRCNWGATLPEAGRTAVAGEASHTILARALACGLVAGFASSAHWMTVTS